MIESGYNPLPEEEIELRARMFEEAGIDVEQDSISEIFNKLYDWLEGDSPLVKQVVESAFNHWSQQLPDVVDIKMGQADSK